MNCQDTELLMHGYIDDELDVLKSLEVERHFEECAACSRAYQDLRGLRQALRANAPYYVAPPKLKQRIERRRHPVWMAAAAIAATVIVALWFVPRSNPEQEVVAGHIRSLMANHLTDVTSTDQHTVKPWFSGKLDFSPVVKHFAPQGFRLKGGRLDYLDGRPVAALVYQRRAHTINVFTWPEQADRSEKRSVRQGYNLVSWTRGGMAFRVVSDLNAAELEEVARLLQ